MQRKKALALLLGKWGAAHSKKATKIGGLGFLAVSLAACNSDDDDSASADLAAQLAAANAAMAAAQAAQAAAETAQAAAEAANTPAAAAAAAVAPVTALTTNIDQVLPNDAGQQLTSGGTTAATQALQSMDVIDMGGGADTLHAIVVTAVVPQLSNVETINLSTTVAATTVDMSGSTGYESITNTGSTQALVVTNIALGTVLGVSNTGAGGTFTYAATTGTTDTSAVSLTNVTGGTYVMAGIETLNLTSTGAVNNTATFTAVNTATINVDGTKGLNLGTLPATAVTVNAADSSGAITATSASGAGTTFTYTGSSSIDTLTAGNAAVTDVINLNAGNDKATFALNLTVLDTVDGGDGSDTLVATMALMDVLDASGTANMNVSNFEVLEVSDDLAGTLTTQNVQAGIAQVHLAEGGTGGVTGAAGDLQITIGNPLTGLLTLTDTGTAITDSATVKSSSLTAEAWADNNGIRSAGYETITIDTSTPSGSATDQQFAAIDYPAATGDTGAVPKLVFVGTSKVDLTAAPSGWAEIDASGMTANNTTANYLTFDSNTLVPVYTGATFKITGSPGRDLLLGDANATNTIDGGAGADTLTGGTGNDTITGGEGNDTINTSSNPATGGENISGGAGDDTIVFGAEYYVTAADQDVVDGGDGTDTLSLTTLGVAKIDQYSVSVANALNAGMSNMEVLLISDQLNTGVDLDMARLDGINSITLNNGISGDESLIGVQSGVTVKANNVNNNATAILTITHADATGSADVINYNMNSATAAPDFGVVAMAATETINVSSSEPTANALVRVQTLGLNITNASTTGGTTLNVSGTEAITVDTVINANVINSTLTGADGDFIMTGAGGSNLAQTITTGVGGDTIIAGGGADIVNTGGGADSISGNSGADTLTGGEGTDTINGGPGSDTIDLTEVTSVADVITYDYSNRGVDVDVIKGFAPAVDDINIDHSAIFTAATVSAINSNTDVFTEIFDDNNLTAAAAGNVVLSLQTAAGTVTDGAQMLVLQGGTFLTEGDVEEALETGGTFALTTHADSDTVGTSFLVAYTNGTDANVAAVRAAVRSVNDSDYEAGDLTVTDLFTIDGISAITATTFAATSFDYF
jgi:hypothetical protein